MMRFFFLLVLLLIFSCEKYECVKSQSPDMIGDWVHFSEDGGFNWLYINKNGRGTMHGKNNHGNNQDTQVRGWYIKNDVLYFSRFYNKVESDMFIIDQYPELATTEISYDFDTVKTGDFYMVLNNRIYRRK